MVKALLVKNYQIKLLKKFGIFSWFCVLDLIHFLFNSRHTKTIKILICENNQNKSRNRIHEKESSGAGATLMKNKSSEAGVMFT